MESKIQSILQQLAVLSEREMRKNKLTEFLSVMTLDEWTDFLHCFFSGFQHSEPFYFLAMALQDQREQGVFSEENLVWSFQISKEKNFEMVQNFLSLFGKEPMESQKQAFMVHSAFEGLTLGHRKSFAKQSNRSLIEKLLLDPSPQVVEHLLSNPFLTEKDVLHITSRRPNLPDIFEVVAQNVRWIQRYSVRCSIAKNPYAPPVLSFFQLFFLQEIDLEEIHMDFSYPLGLRKQAQFLLGRKQKEIEPEER